MTEYILATMYLLTALACLEAISRMTSLRPAYTRKILHVLMAILVIMLTSLVDYQGFFTLGVIFFIGMSLLRRRLPLKALSDRSEDSFGDLLFPLGVAAAALMAADESHFIVSIAVLGIADTAAYLVGRKVRSFVIIHGKTLAGSVAFAVTTSIIVATIIPLPFIALAAVLLALTELLSPRGSDNFTVPVICALLLSAFQ